MAGKNIMTHEECMKEIGSVYPFFGKNINAFVKLIGGKESPVSIDDHLVYLTTAEKAELRRHNPLGNAPLPYSFWKILSPCGYASKLSPEDEKGWAVILKGISITAELCISSKNNFGSALGALGEDSAAPRFDALMRSYGDRFYRLLLHELYWTNSKEAAFSWVYLGALCLCQTESRRALRQGLCRYLTRSFYLSLWHSSHITIEEEKENK